MSSQSGQCSDRRPDPNRILVFQSSFIGKSVCAESPCLSLQECQRKLDHKLGLDSYLLKPVQRLTKYQLLLKVLFIWASQSWRGLQRCSAHNHTRRKDLIRNNNNLWNKSFVQKSKLKQSDTTMTENIIKKIISDIRTEPEPSSDPHMVPSFHVVQDVGRVSDPVFYIKISPENQETYLLLKPFIIFMLICFCFLRFWSLKCSVSVCSLCL